MGIGPSPGVPVAGLGRGEPPPVGSGIEPSLGLALSGGGVRATLFSLGVVIGLIESGWHRKLRCIASVSGGSILNAVLAHGPDLTRLSLDSFRPMASRLAAVLAIRGAFALDPRTIGAFLWYLAGVIVKALPAAALALAVVLDSVRRELHWDLNAIPWDRVPWPIVGWVVLGGLVLALWYSRGQFQETKYRSVIGAATAENRGATKLTMNVQDWGTVTTTSADEPGVMHVLVATDLLSGEPMYFSNKFVYCRPYGWSPPNDLGTAEAVYSSAAFPAVFPPKRLRLNRLNLQNGEMPGALPRAARLVDGGVYNNLGTDWFRVLEEHSGNPDLLWAFGELSVRPLRIRPEHVITVNAGAPSRRVKWLNPFTTLARIMSVLYDNTVRPRVELIRLKDEPIIDIAQSPIELAERLKSLGGEQGSRAQHVAKVLAGKAQDFWRDFRSETAGTPTKLSSAGPREAARLMLHGYLSSLVLLHVRFGAPLPETIRGEHYFLSLVRRKPTTAAGEASQSGSTHQAA